MMETESLVERRRRLMRSELARIAVKLFAEHGFDAVTVDEVAAAAGMSGRTFFRYFASKDEVVLQYGQQLHERLLRALDERPAREGAPTALRNAYVTTSHVEPANRKQVRQIGQILESAPSLWAMAHGVPMATDDGLVIRVARRMKADPGDPEPRTIVAAMAAVSATEWRAWVAGGGNDDPADRIGTALALLQRGFDLLEQGGATARRRSA